MRMQRVLSARVFSSRVFSILLAASLVGSLGAYYVQRQRTAPPDAAMQAAEKAKVPEGMVYIPGGFTTLGSEDEDAEEDVKPARRVYVRSFCMDRTEVTNADYRRFLPTHTFPKGEESLPVTNVTYDEAAAYAAWAGKRLPTEEEWERAARGDDARRYPWGDRWQPERVAPRRHAKPGEKPSVLTEKRPAQCAVGESRVQPVGSKPEGASPFGCLDMAGNAWEWVQGFYNGDPDKRILRGGAVGYGERACRTYSRAIEGSGAT